MIVITGGAGYVGKHIARLLGAQAIVVDDLRNSERPPDGVQFIESDIRRAYDKIRWQDVQGIIHCAGSISPRESMEAPALYWDNNVAAALEFFSHVPITIPVVFSSTCAVYGKPKKTPISEDQAPAPITPYGRTKLACEQLLADLGFKVTALRYFNPAGGHESHKDEIHLIPRAVQAALTGEPFTAYGNGTQIRDFLHVEDLAQAHLKALEKPPGVYNLGSGKGSSVNDVLETVERVADRTIQVKQVAAHPADPEILIADITKARNELGWSPTRDLKRMVTDTVKHLRRNLKATLINSGP